MKMSIEDTRFAEKIRAVDPEALKIVVKTYLGQIHRAARSAGLDPEQAEEVTQATFTTFIEKAENFEGRSHVRTWLFGILYHKIRETRRQLQQERQMDEIDDAFEGRFDSRGSWVRPPQPVDVQLYASEIRELFEDCLESVPTQQRLAFNLREVEGLSSDEVCKILNITNTNLGVIIYRVRNRLRECLEAKGVERES